MLSLVSVASIRGPGGQLTIKKLKNEHLVITQ